MQSTIQYIKNELANTYPESEIKGFIRIIFESLLNLTYTDILLQKDRKVDVSDLEQIKKIIARLKLHEPIQYILGETEFYDLALKVNPSVLIPRPETEELVHWIINSEIKSDARILDIGTGSGCIPLALKKNRSEMHVFAVDISEGAVDTAKANAEYNGLEVDFFQTDILSWKNYSWPKYDIIVSNPPYVRNSEKMQMENNVLEHEPDGALFVEDDNPLIFYLTIAEFAQVYLEENAFLFFEINEYLGEEMRTLLKGLGYRNIELRKDVNGRDRMMRCQK